MKCLTKPLRRACWLQLVASVVALVALASQSQAQIVTLTDQNSLAQINLDSQAGMFNWSVNNGVTLQNQLSQQWFWYSLGGPTRSIDTIGGLAFVTPNARQVVATYSGAGFNVSIDYLLTGASLSSGVSDIGETITINNTSGAQLPFHFYQFSNFQLEGTTSGETVQLGTNLRGLFNEADVTKVSNPGLTETVTTPGAQQGLTGLSSVSLTSASLVNLGTSGTSTNGSTWALQWDLSIAPGSSVIISKDKYLQIPVIPEPSVLALGSLALVGIAAWRRRLS